MAKIPLGSITLLFQDDRGGLQVQSPNGNYIDATPIANTIVINAGDLLARWSNDTIKSTKHRVVEPPLPSVAAHDGGVNGHGNEGGNSSGGGGVHDGEEKGKKPHVYPARYSIAYFCNPNFDCQIEAIPNTVVGERRYSGVRAGEHLVKRLTETY